MDVYPADAYYSQSRPRAGPDGASRDSRRRGIVNPDAYDIVSSDGAGDPPAYVGPDLVPLGECKHLVLAGSPLSTTQVPH